MAKVVVVYNVQVTQRLNWPDDELDDFNYENLECNLDPSKAGVFGDVEISSVKLNGEEHYF